MVRQTLKRSLRLAGLLLLSVGLLGADCPHCDLSLATAQAEEPTQSGCHQKTSTEMPMPSDAEPALECSCPEQGEMAAVPSTPPRPASPIWVALAEIPGLGSDWPAENRTVSKENWRPPPYPGFADNTVVLLN